MSGFSKTCAPIATRETSVRVVTLPWPSSKLTPHAKGNWYSKSEATKGARWMARITAMKAGVHLPTPDCSIYVELYPSAYRGDVHNMPGRLKAYIDGIADAMGCDDRRFKIHWPVEWAGKRNPGAVVFRIVPNVVAVPLRGVVS